MTLESDEDGDGASTVRVSSAGAERVRLPAAALAAEANLDPVALQKLADRVEQLLIIASAPALSFRVIPSAEGPRPDAETINRPNELLGEIQEGWRLG